MAQNGYVNLLGKTRIGETLQAKVGDPNGINQVRYQWFANGKAISGATQSTLLLDAGHVGKQISVQASYTDRAGNRETPVSEYSPAVMNKPAKLPDYKAASGQPVVSISGTPTVKEGQKASYTVKLDKAAREDVSVDIEIVHGTSNSLDAAISHDMQRVIIKKGQTSASFTVDTAADGISEGRESYQVRISQAKLGAVYEEHTAHAGRVDKQSTILTSYSYPDNGAADPYWAAVHAKGSGKIPMVLINPNSGPGKIADANYVKLVNANTGAGFKNIAYIKTVYGSRSLEDVKADIDTYFKLYGKKNIHGFFFDEVGTQSNHQVAYMAEIYNHVKSISPQMVVMANPGWHIPDAIAPYADIFVTGEMSANNYIHHYQPATSAFENTAANSNHIMHMVYGADPSQYDKILQLSRERNAGWIFITSDDQTHPHYNPYDDLPKDFSRLIDKSHLGMPASPVGGVKALPTAIAIGNAAVKTDIVETAADTERPHIQITADKTALQNGAVAKLTFTPSEAVKGFDWDDVQIDGKGYLLNFRPTHDGKYVSDLVTYGEGNINLSVKPHSFSDLAGNTNIAQTPLTVQVGSVHANTPTIRVSSDKTTLKVGESAQLLFTPSEKVHNFDWNDVTIKGGGYLMDFRPTSDGKYSARLVTYQSGKVDLSIKAGTFSNNAGIQNNDIAPLVFDVKPKGSARELPEAHRSTDFGDAAPAVAARNITPLTAKQANTPPKILSMTSNKSSLKVGEEAVITFKLSEKVKNFEWNDIAVANGIGRMKNLTAVKPSETTYTGTFVATKAGTAKLTVAAGSFSDMQHMQNKTGASLTLTVEEANTPPTLTITAANSKLKLGETTILTFTLSEEVRNFAANDIIVTGGRLKGGLKAVNKTTYTAEFVADHPGTANIKVRAGSFSDMQYLQNKTDSNLTLNIEDTRDTTPPKLTITAATNELKVGETTKLTLSLSEPVRNFEANDLIVKGGRLGNDWTKINDTTYTVSFTAQSTGTANIQVRAGSFSDTPAGNQNHESHLDLKIAAQPLPTVSIVGDKQVGEGKSANYSVKLSHKVDHDVVVNVALKSASGSVNTLQQVIIPKGETSATISGKLPAGSHLPVKEFAQIHDLLKAPLKSGETVRLTGHNHTGDAKILYKITDSVSEGSAISKVAIKLNNGKYAVPDSSDRYLPAENDAATIDQFIAVGKTYQAAGTKLMWNNTVDTPIGKPGEIIHNNADDNIGGKFGLTCSTFVGMVMAAWKFENTTYVKDKNLASHTWGTDFAVPSGLPKSHVGADQLLKYLYSTDRTAFFNGDKNSLKKGDILFFSNPSKHFYEEKDKNGNIIAKYPRHDVFMNAYHVGIYLGEGEILHSAGAYHNAKGGVVVENVHKSLWPDLSFVARPRLSNKDQFQIQIPDDNVARNDALTLSISSVRGAKSDNKSWKVNIIDNDRKAKELAELKLFSLETDDVADVDRDNDAQIPTDGQTDSADMQANGSNAVPQGDTQTEARETADVAHETATAQSATAHFLHDPHEIALILPDNFSASDSNGQAHDLALPVTTATATDAPALTLNGLLDMTESPLLLDAAPVAQEITAMETPAPASVAYAIEPGMAVRFDDVETYAVL